ncbi:GNAT family N-acetyltransferase [Halpernia frigidisoli]|uniref:Predicted N-acyltransferase, GNAT family n=1 Tax=Halpernia frigidisoli TaxID=1125876 RepID=A0A1I3H3U3_9FLAO|nr:GNAT family N-acetyltransferase [Halpernia frigidisoli]SFI30232.1 Predicted N-acyltransferase, GNAT family [Halpernia frigidisoli]
MIKKISSTETHQLRKNVLGENNPDYQFIYNGDDDQTTFHLGYFDGEILSGILTVMQTDETTFQFRGMAVLQSQHGKNVGKKLLDFASELVKPNAKTIWLNARKWVIPFYEKNGFTGEDDFFNIDGIGLHLKMSKLNTF